MTLTPTSLIWVKKQRRYYTGDNTRVIIIFYLSRKASITNQTILFGVKIYAITIGLKKGISTRLLKVVDYHFKAHLLDRNFRRPT